jgi:hypothetical protein
VDNIKMDFVEIGWGGVDWTDLLGLLGAVAHPTDYHIEL